MGGEEVAAMRITDLIDISTLRELNCTLSDALGMDMLLVDADGVVTASASCAMPPDLSGDDVAVVPVCVDGKEIAAWHLREGNCRRREADSIGAYNVRHVGSSGSGAVCQLVRRSPVVPDGAVALVSHLARTIAEYASVNLALLERVKAHSVAAMEATAAGVRMQRLVDSSPVGLVELDRSGAVLWANRRAQDMLGAAIDVRIPAGQSKRWAVESIDGVPYAASWTGLARRLCRGEMVSDLHCVLTGRPGERLDLRVDVSPRHSEEGRISRIMCAVCEQQSTPRRRTDPVTRLSRDVLAPLTQAWLELDAGRQSIRHGNADISGQLEIVAGLIRETVAGLVTCTSEPAHPDMAAVGSGARCSWQER
jgi:PAS domain-containing protein